MTAQNRFLAIAACLVVASALSRLLASEPEKSDSHGWPFTQQRLENPIQVESRWNEIEGHRVAVEGVVWGTFKGLGYYVILHDNIVYLDGLDVDELKLDGKIVRVVGTLAIRHVKKAPPGVQGYSYDFDAIIVKASHAKVLDRVTWPWVEDLGKPLNK